MAVTSTPSFSSFYNPADPLDVTVLTGSSFDTKIGYKFRAAAQRELYVILQDIEGTPLTDSSGEPLVSLIDGFVTSELTSEKALGIVLPTVPEEKQVLDFTLFGDEFELRRRQIGAAQNGGDIPPYIEITNPQGGYKYISEKDTIEIASGSIKNVDQLYGSTEFSPGVSYVYGQMVYTLVSGTTARLYDNVPSAGTFDDGINYAASNTPPTHTSGIVNNGDCAFRFIGTGIQNGDGVVRNIRDGREIESFVIEQITESINGSGDLILRYQLNTNPLNEILKTDSVPVSLIRKKLSLTRVGTLGVEEVFPSTSEVSSSLLGIPRAETQLGLFSNVSTYGFDPDSFVYYTDNRSIGPAVWVERETEREGPHYQSRVEEVGNEGALRISSFPVPYTFPYPPLSKVLNADGDDIGGRFSETAWFKWQNWLSLGKTLFEYFKVLRDLESGENKEKYNNFLTRFLPAINIWDDETFYGNQFFGGSTTEYYRQISIWTETWNFMNAGTLFEPVTNQKLNFEWLNGEQLQLRGTGTDLTLNSGSITGTGNEGVDSEGNPTTPVTYTNPFKEEWLNRTWTSSNEGGVPTSLDFVPGYNPVGGQFALLQSRQAFRYQPGRISGYTFGTRATMTKETANNYAEWGIFNDFDEYVFRREGANFFIVRRSTVHLPLTTRQELGVADADGVDDDDEVKYYDKIIAGDVYQIQEIILPREKFNGDSLNGNGPSGYLLTTDEITMYKIEFGWYGAIGLRLYAYIPIENGKARWVVVHTFVIENKLLEPSMGDPFFRFKYEMQIGASQAPRITEPQILYKYGTSMYIDGGDEGTVNTFSQTSDIKNLPFQAGGGNYVSIFGIYPKTNIVTGGTDAQGNPVSVPNKKIIIPKSMSITATAVTPGETNAMAEINFTKCTACTGSAYLYMPNIENGNHNQTRKFKKLPTNDISNTLTLAPIDIVIADADANDRRIYSSDSNISYLRNGDFIAEVTDANSVILLGNGHIVDLKYAGQIGDLTAGGTGYLQSLTYTDVPLTGGTGTGMTADIVTDSVGAISSVTPTVKGSGYTVGDVLSVDNTNVGGQGAGMQYTLTGVDTYGFRLVSVEGVVDTPSSNLAGQTITVQPCFILTETNRKFYNLETSDVYTKVIRSKLWNTYIGNSGTNNVGNLPTTADILGYIASKRWDLEEERRLDPSRIVENINPVGGGAPTPADFFGDPATETFDALMDAKSTIVVSPQPLSGPTGVIKWLENYTKSASGNVREWEMGFTPFRPVFNQATGELEKWVAPSGDDYTEQCYYYDETTSTYVAQEKLAKIIGDDKTVSLSLHPYQTSVTYTGFENGENWYARINPFTEDFRIPSPKGSSSGRCAQARLLKQPTVTSPVEQIDSSTTLSSITLAQFGTNAFEGSDANEQTAAMTAYKNTATYFLRRAGSRIYSGNGDPTGGQIAINPQGTESYIKFFYGPSGDANLPQIARFAGPEKSYVENVEVEPGVFQDITYYIIPILDNEDQDVNVADARDANGTNINPDPNSFNIAYNGVQMVAWFSGTDTNPSSEGRYNTPNSYTGGGNNEGVFNFDAFPMYAFVKMRDGARIRGAELHDIDELNNLSTQNPQWKRNFNQVINTTTGQFDPVDRTTYGLASSLATGQLNVNGVGDTIQNSNIPDDDVVPAAFQQVSRLSSSTIDTQGESILRPGSRLTTLYINNETKYFDLEDVFGFDRKVLTPDVVNTEAMFIVGRAIGNTAVDIEINITYVEQL